MINTPIKKEIFLEALDIIKSNQNKEFELCNTFEKLVGHDYGYESLLIYSEDNDFIIKLLNSIFNIQGDSVIEFFIYELDFGKEWYKDCYVVNGESIDLSSSEALWEYLIK